MPATLALAPVAAGHPAAVAAVLLGVNIGPNATYPGSLATLLWRRQVPREVEPSAREFHAFGLATVPALLVLASAALWLAVRVFGA
jgi:arsenical pump membrane protein